MRRAGSVKPLWQPVACGGVSGTPEGQHTGVGLGDRWTIRARIGLLIFLVRDDLRVQGRSETQRDLRMWSRWPGIC
jgi:hypothetical protein